MIRNHVQANCVLGKLLKKAADGEVMDNPSGPQGAGSIGIMTQVVGKQGEGKQGVGGFVHRCVQNVRNLNRWQSTGSDKKRPGEFWADANKRTSAHNTRTGHRNDSGYVFSDTMTPVTGHHHCGHNRPSTKQIYISQEWPWPRLVQEVSCWPPLGCIFLPWARQSGFGT